MAKNNMPPKAPKTPAGKKENVPAAAPAASVLAQNIPSSKVPLDRNHAMDGFAILERMVYSNPTSKDQFGLSDETIAGIGKMIVTGTMALLVEAMESGDQFLVERISEEKRQELLSCAPAFGIKVNLQLLPAPDENGQTSIPSSAVSVSKETAERIAASKKATQEVPELDPAKIENEEQLAKALNYIFHDQRKAGIVSMFASADTLYRNWLIAQRGNDKAASEEVSKLTVADTYGRITELIDTVGTSPLIADGIGKYMYAQTSATCSPVQAFAILRNGLKDNDGKLPASDEELATIMKVILEWKIRSEKAVKAQAIAEREKNLEELKKNKKANANGIKDVETQIATIKAEQEHLDDILEFINTPSFDMADEFLINVDKVDENGKLSDDARTARATRGIILSAYYSNLGKSKEIVDKYTEESINKNVQQHIGIIINLFRSATQQNIAYKSAYLTDFVEKEKAEEENLTPTQKKLAEKKAEEAEKN